MCSFQSGRPDSNRRRRVPKTRGLAATLHPDYAKWTWGRSNPRLLVFSQALNHLSYRSVNLSYLPPAHEKRPAVTRDTGPLERHLEG